MDDAQLAGLVGQKHRPGLDLVDPVFLVRSMFEAMQKEALEKLSKVVTDAADQIATSSVLAENNTRARGEATVTEAARWGAEHIRKAGIDAAKLVVGELEGAIAEAQAAGRATRTGMWVSWAAAAVSVVAAVVALLKVVVG